MFETFLAHDEWSKEMDVIRQNAFRMTILDA